VDDPDLVKELDEHKVDYSGHYESKFLSSILSWVLPIGIFFLIWRYAMKKMGPGMGVMSFSKSKAKILPRVRPGSLSPMWPESMRPKKSSRK
jgi:cell division protease FtsH